MDKQVDKSAYAFTKYTGPDRWASYYCQIAEIFAARPSSVLEIGVGDRVVGEQVKKTGVAYACADIAEDLAPDILAPVTKLPLADASYDLVCAFEVLEHLPFEQFETALAELVRVAKRRVLLSLPHYGPSLRLELKVPLLPRLRLAWKVPHHPRHVFDGQHYWEIGKKGYAPAKIRALVRKHGRLIKEFIPFENQYHHFFVLEKV